MGQFPQRIVENTLVSEGLGFDLDGYQGRRLAQSITLDATFAESLQLNTGDVRH